ncbi:hypothetical protein [Erythrobacter sp. WG]|uniref:hypothetical protein n=1 Tax=Erythrobacter sp. WG TaxID=2985510 RepID=UPI00226EA361|nr:hypothetical protein [Erythrobacter sp. WG]MCX9146589.1 hypothetical protein [Erythrobacter sp. WG]
MPEVFLTRHAIQRYRERVADVPAAEIWRAIDCAAVRTAIEFGARFVRLAGGQRLVLEQNRVVTVLPKDHFTSALDRARDHLHGEGGPDA